MIQLTEEEINEILNTPRAGSTAYSNYGWYDNGEYGYTTPKTVRRHEWVPVLLLNFTVYDCKHCGAKQEKTIGAYCEDDSF